MEQNYLNYRPCVGGTGAIQPACKIGTFLLKSTSVKKGCTKSKKAPFSKSNFCPYPSMLMHLLFNVSEFNYLFYSSMPQPFFGIKYFRIVFEDGTRHPRRILESFQILFTPSYMKLNFRSLTQTKTKPIKPDIISVLMSYYTYL